MYGSVRSTENQNANVKNTNQIAYDFNGNYLTEQSFGKDASRSLYSTHGSYFGKQMTDRNLLNSRLWHGVPQLTTEQMAMFEAAYTGHTFIFVVDMPAFMTTGIYKDTNMHSHMKNFKAVCERASMGFSGQSDIAVNFADQEDGHSKKISHVTSVTKDQNNISLNLHEFAGLPVKNALETWVTGIYDYKSQHGNYHGNLGIPGGWCLANHSMSILVVQVTPDWQTIQDAAYYFNMVPTSVPFDHFNYTKGTTGIVEDMTIEFACNEERSPAITFAAERYMNNRVLSMVETSVYNSRVFVANTFGENVSLAGAGHAANLGQYIDKYQYNANITNGEAKENYAFPSTETLTDATTSLQRNNGEIY